MTEQARDWKYANPGYPNVTRDQLRVMNLMMQYDRRGPWAEQRMAELEYKLSELEHIHAEYRGQQEGKICGFCNWLERAACVMQKDRLEDRIAELKESLRQADEFIESIGWDVDFEAFKAQEEQAEDKSCGFLCAGCGEDTCICESQGEQDAAPSDQ